MKRAASLPPGGIAIALASALALAACKPSPSRPGRALAKGLARNLAVAPGGGAAAFLLGAAHPDDRAVPEDLYAGDLWLAAFEAGSTSAEARAGAGSAAPAPARRVGGAVPSSAGAVAFSAGGERLAFLASYRFRAGEGELWLASASGEPRKLADGVRGFGWAPLGRGLAFVKEGRLFVVPDAAALDTAPGGAALTRAAAEGVSSFAWAPDGSTLAARGPASGGGKLWLLGKEGPPREVSAASTDFLFAADGALGILGPSGERGGDRALSVLEPGAREPHSLGRATSFGFAPAGLEMALLSTEKSLGDAFGQLSRVSRAPGSAAQPVGDKVSEWRFSPRGDLVFLSGYDVRSRSGALQLAPRGAPAREISRHVQSFQLSPRGERVLYLLQSSQKGDFKVELWMADLGAPGGPGAAAPAAGGLAAAAPRRIDEGVYGYQLSPDGALLYWKSRCGGGPRSCTLLRAPVDGSAKATQLSVNVAGFDLSADGARLLVAHPHPGAARAVDLAVFPAQGAPAEHEAQPFATEVDPSARFLDNGGHRLIAAQLSAKEPAVFAIELP